MIPKILNKNRPVLVLDDNIIAGIKEKLGPIDSSSNGLTKVTWQELKDLRDNSQLSPGSLYRITDYQCTTTQENTKSAGHQFDIVLLALSENKLAEEGWAMMHDGVDMFDDYDIYTVTFNDGVSKEYYLKIIEIPDESDPDNPYLNTRIVDVKTFRGNEIPNSRIEQYGFIIDDENKTATNAYVSSTQFESYLQTQYSYNYFQNSNLSAWKVWYCLDNDKSRFAWADDSVDESSPATIKIIPSRGGLGDIKTYTRNKSLDVVKSDTQYYGWTAQGITLNIYTTTETPAHEDNLFTLNKKGSMSSYSGDIVSFTPAHEGTGLPNGRGVIYRLIDEWSNDCPYDFKNILYLRKVTSGEIDAQGTDTYIPTFCLYDIGNDEYRDASVFAVEYPDDEGKTRPCFNNYIGSYLIEGINILPLNVFIDCVEQDDTGWSSYGNKLYDVVNSNLTAISSVIILSGTNKTYLGQVNTVLYNDMRVVWETIP